VTTWEPKLEEETEHGISRYRSYGRFYERYWSRLFCMTQADMATFAEQMRARRAALDLTTLARDVIHSRLQQGPKLNSGPAPNGSMPSQVVRLWDPAAQWRVGDRAIVAAPKIQAGRALAPAVGEIRQVGDDHVIIEIDGITAPQVYALGLQSASHLRAGHAGIDPAQQLLKDEIQALADKQDTASQIDLVLWRFGGTVVGRLLHALQADPNFVELNGFWYCVELSRPLREAQLVALAQSLFAGPDRPVTVSEVLELLVLGGPAGAAEQYGAMLSLQGRPDLFTNVGTLSRPRWILAGPPPVPLVAKHAAFDPETFAVLCVAGETLSPQAAQRLWDAGLLRVVLGSDDPHHATSLPPTEEPAHRMPPPPDSGGSSLKHAAAPHRRSLRQWLSFGGRD
jgi:hypothetical protein